ncbi:hypothetical protein [Methanobrevibacter olleyae]|uniref:Uncharacterized protein n=1 Tax=Methanobrevibacter olleyae TaxID=294671 RepID=A0A126QZD0_METOL|nr:hypothetical protein [Methanobrevibacter olleyae]AMK15174.1 hypothetical protein YLM1_0617 [Methanobrevibacter olleyae]SFL45552.1 hypothetical protein SAMN02910297_00926 [Methanobrevibacter olleyae]
MFSIAYTFLIDPFNNNSINAFRKYSAIFWSNLVKEEFDKVFISKKEVLVRFYKKLLKDLKQEKVLNLRFNDLNKYIKQGTSIKKDYKQIKSSLSSFWDRYVDESFPSLDSLEIAINLCLRDLRIVSYKRKTDWENYSQLTEKRTNKYFNLNNKLRRNGVHPPDNEIVLDAHDHNLKTSYDLDFITFDKNCYDGAKLADFSFHDVKFIWDFTF